MTKPIALIPFICGAGATTTGCEDAPSFLKHKNLTGFLQNHNVNAQWFEDPDILYNGHKGKKAHQNLPAPGSKERTDLTLWHCLHIKEKVTQAVQSGFFPVTIGGDHSMAAGSISGFAEAYKAHGKIGVIWFDAHPDLNTWRSSTSGSPHGMPVAALLGIGQQAMQKLGITKAALDPAHIFYIGIRSIDEEEQLAIDNLKIQHLTGYDVQNIGVETSFLRAMNALKDVDYLILSFDLDGLSPSDAPSVGTPVEKGIALAHVLPALEKIQTIRKFDLIEIAEFNPNIGNAEKTYETFSKVIKTLLKNY